MKQKLEQYSYAAKKAKQHKLFSIILLIIFVFVILNLIIKYLIFPVQQKSISMQPDIPQSAFVMVTPLPIKVKRGDVILLEPRTTRTFTFFNKTANLFTSFFTAQQKNLVNNNKFPGTQNELRRVIGLPGDSYYIRDYVMYIKPAGESHYLTEFEIINKKYNVTFTVAPSNWDSTIGVEGYSEEKQLGPDEYFVLGDNRKTCSDSRLYGPVKAENIKGKALITYFPFNKIKRLN